MRIVHFLMYLHYIPNIYTCRYNTQMWFCELPKYCIVSLFHPSSVSRLNWLKTLYLVWFLNETWSLDELETVVNLGYYLTLWYLQVLVDALEIVRGYHLDRRIFKSGFLRSKQASYVPDPLLNLHYKCWWRWCTLVIFSYV